MPNGCGTIGRFKTRWLAAPENVSALANLSGRCIDLVPGIERLPAISFEKRRALQGGTDSRPVERPDHPNRDPACVPDGLVPRSQGDDPRARAVGFLRRLLLNHPERLHFEFHPISMGKSC